MERRERVDFIRAEGPQNRPNSLKDYSLIALKWKRHLQQRRIATAANALLIRARPAGIQIYKISELDTPGTISADFLRREPAGIHVVLTDCFFHEDALLNLNALRNRCRSSDHKIHPARKSEGRRDPLSSDLSMLIISWTLSFLQPASSLPFSGQPVSLQPVSLQPVLPF